MKFFHITQAKRKLKERLQDYLPIALSEADRIADDGVTTPPPEEWWTTDKAAIFRYPSIEIIVTDSTPTHDSFAKIYRHRVVIGVTCGSDDDESASTMIERYVWCLRHVLRDEALPPIEGTGPIDTGGEQYTPLAQRPEAVEWPFVKGAFIEVFITTVE